MRFSAIGRSWQYSCKIRCRSPYEILLDVKDAYTTTIYKVAVLLMRFLKRTEKSLQALLISCRSPYEILVGWRLKDLEVLGLGCRSPYEILRVLTDGDTFNEHLGCRSPYEIPRGTLW